MNQDEFIATVLKIEDLGNIDLEDFRAKLTEAAFPMLRDEFTLAAIECLTDWVERTQEKGSEAQRLTSKKVSSTIIDIYETDKKHGKAINLLPEFAGLKDGACKRREDFKDRAAETLAGLLAETVGTTQGCKTIPDMFREPSHASQAEKHQMPKFSQLVRLSTLIQAA